MMMNHVALAAAAALLVASSSDNLIGIEAFSVTSNNHVAGPSSSKSSSLMTTRLSTPLCPPSLKAKRPAASRSIIGSNADNNCAPSSSSQQSPSSLFLFGKGKDKVMETTAVSTDTVLRQESSLITPEGYGFTTSAERILREADRGAGYVMTVGSDQVMTVMHEITSGKPEVALVYDDQDASKPLLGLFTETDYVSFSTQRANQVTNEEESATFLCSPIRDFVTPAADLIAIAAQETASVAIAVMQEQGVRHLLVADKVTPDRRLGVESLVKGVINMQDVMSIVQKDERLSLNALATRYPNMPNAMDQMREEMKAEANRLAADPETAKQDIVTVGSSILFAASLALFFSQSPWLHDHADIAMIGIFILGYLGIIFEEVFDLNKAGVALLMSTGLWVTYADYYDSTTGSASESVIGQLSDQLAEVSDICFFLLAASAIVEVVDAHEGFKIVTNQIQTTSKKQLFWIIGFITFFLSAILNNLTVTIVMVSLLRKLIPDVDDRKLFGAMVVVAANAGGVWTPIGDVTTTMLWINHQLSTVPTVLELFLPSAVCLVASLFFLVNQVEEDESLTSLPEPTPLSKRGQIVFWSGIACLLSVPIFNELTGLPPYLAMLTGLGAIWTLTDVMHMGDESEEQKVPAALSKLDTSGILFFLGILMSIGVLDKSGLLKSLAVFLSDNLPSLDIIATVIGLASALIDNVPLVAATMGMYEISDYGTDDKLWQLIALCAGTGGSILVIGSASGVALMGLEKVDFLWYAKKVSVGAAVGYFAGIATYLAQYAVINGGAGIGQLLPQAAVATDMIQSGAV